MDSFFNSNGKCSRDLPDEVSISNDSRCTPRTQSDCRNQFSNQKRKSLNLTLFRNWTDLWRWNAHLHFDAIAYCLVRCFLCFQTSNAFLSVFITWNFFPHANFRASLIIKTACLYRRILRCAQLCIYVRLICEHIEVHMEHLVRYRCLHAWSHIRNVCGWLWREMQNMTYASFSWQ